MTAELTRLEAIMLDLIKQQSEAIDRNQIAALLGRKMLNPHDKQVLKNLADKRLIECIEQPMGIARTKYLYRAL
jgi:hypothetical protein